MINPLSSSDLPSFSEQNVSEKDTQGQNSLILQELNFYYGKSHTLKNINISFKAKTACGLIGPSGCGKSTLLRILNRIYDLYPGQQATGKVLFDGMNILSSGIDVSDLRARIGMVFQKPTPFAMSIFDNVAFGVRLHEKLSRADLQIRVEESLRKAALWDEVKDRLRSHATSLSGGQQQRLCIARTIATRPEIILLDEATSALDPISTLKIEELVHELKQDFTIIMVTHNMQQAARCTDQVAFLYLGELIETGNTEVIFTSPKEKKTQEYITGRFG